MSIMEKEMIKTDRPSKDAYYLGIARAVARRSTCIRRQYGAVVVNNDIVVSTGYNGAPHEKVIIRTNGEAES